MKSNPDTEELPQFTEKENGPQKAEKSTQKSKSYVLHGLASDIVNRGGGGGEGGREGGGNVLT